VGQPARGGGQAIPQHDDSLLSDGRFNGVELRAGSELPELVRTTGLEQFNRLAAVNDEFVAIHMDAGAGREAGHAGAIGMGSLQLTYMHSLLREWLGPDGEILALRCRFRAPNASGQRVAARGRIESVRRAAGRVVVELAVWVQAGPSRLADGDATVAIADPADP
jgi:acyl dehydratase